MPSWKPDNRFKRKAVYIIGGGPSLVDFDWNLLKCRKTIGCNAAFKLGEEICDMVFFSDFAWFNKFHFQLAKYKGDIVSHCPSLHSNKKPWLKMIRRVRKGLSTEAVAFNGSSGASAINLALLLGAKKVYLLGFDCKCKDTTNPNWHSDVIEKLNPEVYNKFLEGFNDIAKALPSTYPGAEIINVNDDSAIDCFKTVSVKSHFRKRTRKRNVPSKKK